MDENAEQSTVAAFQFMALGPNQCHPQWNKWLYKPEMRQENQRWIISPYISTCTPGFFLGGILGAVVGVAMNMLKSQCISRSLRLFGWWRSLWSERGAWSHLGILMNSLRSVEVNLTLPRAGASSSGCSLWPENQMTGWDHRHGIWCSPNGAHHETNSSIPFPFVWGKFSDTRLPDPRSQIASEGQSWSCIPFAKVPCKSRFCYEELPCLSDKYQKAELQKIHWSYLIACSSSDTLPEICEKSKQVISLSVQLTSGTLTWDHVALGFFQLEHTFGIYSTHANW